MPQAKACGEGSEAEAFQTTLPLWAAHGDPVHAEPPSFSASAALWLRDIDISTCLRVATYMDLGWAL